MARRRYSKYTKKGNIYYQFDAGMRELMCQDPIKSMVDDATLRLYNWLSMTGYGRYGVDGRVAGFPEVGEDISWHGYVLADWHAINANKKYNIIQKALNTIGG